MVERKEITDVTYTCEHCHKSYGCVQAALDCEKNHQCLHPEEKIGFYVGGAVMRLGKLILSMLILLKGVEYV